MQTLSTSQFLQQHKHLQPMLVFLNKQAVSFTNALAGKTPFSWQKDLLVMDIDHPQRPIAINPLEASLYSNVQILAVANELSNTLMEIFCPHKDWCPKFREAMKYGIITLFQTFGNTWFDELHHKSIPRHLIAFSAFFVNKPYRKNLLLHLVKPSSAYLYRASFFETPQPWQKQWMSFVRQVIKPFLSQMPLCHILGQTINTIPRKAFAANHPHPILIIHSSKGYLTKDTRQKGLIRFISVQAEGIC